MNIFYWLIPKVYAAVLCLPEVAPEKLEIEHIEQIILCFSRLFFGVLIPVATIVLIWGAFQYLTAYGNEEKAKKGKTTVFWAIFGLIVAFLAYVIIGELWRFMLCPVGEPCEIPGVIPII